MSGFNASAVLNKLGGSNVFVNAPATAVTQLLAPGSNAAGVWIRSGFAVVGGSNNVQLYADTSAPASSFDVTKRCILVCQGTANELPYPIFLPAGVGLWMVVSAPGSGAGGGTLDIL
jgi:hypothetical protein